MAGKRKRKNGVGGRRIHPRNKYSDNPPDFRLLASLYPSFGPYVFYSLDGRPKIDWTDFNATRELTRVLLLRDHGLDWWIPDGQLCPTVPNRSNYIHWIEDLLASDIIPATRTDGDVKGFDIGTGANCIYPLLGASILGWNFIGSDITDVAMEWANRNVKSNPHISDLIEIRRVGTDHKMYHMEESQNSHKCTSSGGSSDSSNTKAKDADFLVPSVLEIHSSLKKCYNGPPILLDVVKDGENFDFCMCNPPFFETMEEAGLNPKTSCGGTPEEMVCSGGEHAFIARIIDDSTKLKRAFRWYTSMVGRKSNLNILVSELWNVGATIVKTTEFVQGRTSRWGLAWSFLPVSRKMMSSQKIWENNLSFMLELERTMLNELARTLNRIKKNGVSVVGCLISVGLQRQHSAFNVLQSVESYLANTGASCKLDAAAFSVDVTISEDQIDAILKNQIDKNMTANYHHELSMSNTSSDYHRPPDVLRFRILVFQPNSGTLLVKGTLLEKVSSISGVFSLLFQHLEEVLIYKFCSGRDAPSSSHRR